MSDRPTPETDAVAAHEGNWDTKALRMTNHARRLERERDKAMEDATNYYAKLGELIEERDKAREELEVCRGIIKRTETARNSALTDLTETEKERDEARDIAGELSMAASHCLGWHDCRLKLAEKITATLQLWHKHKEAMK